MNIAILGYGVVGKGVEQVAQENGIIVSHILMRSDFELTKDNMTYDFDEIVDDCDVDVVVECIGGDEPAFTYACKAMKKGHNVVSSNKKMIAKHYRQLAQIAKEENVCFLFSSACGGTIPFLPTLNNIKQSDDLYGFKGIINGTSNYILNKMYYENLDFAEALKKAQELGYAESDPSDDIDGVDTANKTVLSMGVGFDCFINLQDIFVRGIRHYSLKEIEFIKKRGYHCCLLAKGYKNGDGYCVSVMPSFVKDTSVFYNIRENYNCLLIEAKNVGRLSLIGQGAGSLPTASNIIRDIQMLNNPYLLNFKKDIKPDDDHNCGTFYLRTSKTINNEYIEEELGNNIYITKKISINELKKLIDDNDFVGEIIDD